MITGKALSAIARKFRIPGQAVGQNATRKPGSSSTSSKMARPSKAWPRKKTAGAASRPVGKNIEWETERQGFSVFFVNAFRQLRELATETENHRLCRWNPKKLYIKNTFSIERSCSSFRPQRKGVFYGERTKSGTYEMAVQVPYCFHP